MKKQRELEGAVLQLMKFVAKKNLQIMEVKVPSGYWWDDLNDTPPPKMFGVKLV
jgi:hypothetical protein